MARVSEAIERLSGDYITTDGTIRVPLDDVQAVLDGYADARALLREAEEALEGSQELLEDWLGAECDPGCECILHSNRDILARLRAAVGEE